jgi:hypothetical protein
MTDPEALLDPSTGKLQRPIDAGLLLVPRSVWLDGESLHWEITGSLSGGTGARLVRPSPGLLSEFLRLESAEAEEVLRYARRWGVLALCEHGLPRSHRSDPVPGTFEVCGGLWPDLVEKGLAAGEEPLAKWRELSREAKLILRAAAALHESSNGTAIISRGDFTRLLFGVRPLEETGEPRVIGWAWILEALGRWVERGNVGPMIRVDQANRLTLVLGTVRRHRSDISGLFGALAVQILLAVVNKSGARLCASCGAFFAPKRVQTGRRSFCPECGRKGANKIAARDSRKRRRDESNVAGRREVSSSSRSSRPRSRARSQR